MPGCAGRRGARLARVPVPPGRERRLSIGGNSVYALTQRPSAATGHPPHNVGIATGPSGLVVLDLDTHGHLPDGWREMPGSATAKTCSPSSASGPASRGLPPTWWQRRPTDGICTSPRRRAARSATRRACSVRRSTCAPQAVTWSAPGRSWTASHTRYSTPRARHRSRRGFTGCSPADRSRPDRAAQLPARSRGIRPLRRPGAHRRNRPGRERNKILYWASGPGKW